MGLDETQRGSSAGGDREVEPYGRQGDELVQVVRRDNDSPLLRAIQIARWTDPPLLQIEFDDA